MFRHDLGLKIFSLLIGLAMWFYVTYPAANQPLRIRVFTTIYTNLDADKYKIAKSDKTIKVPVRGPVDTVNKLQDLADSQFLAEVDLQDAVPGTHDYPLVHLDFGSSVSAPGVSFLPPRTVTVTIEEKTLTTFPVTFEPTNLPPGQGVISQTITPDRVTIRGTKEDLNKVRNAVAIVDLSGVTPDREYTAKVDLKDGKGETVQGVEAVPDTVEVRPMLGPATDQVKVPVAYSWKGELRHGYTLRDVKLNPDVVVIKGKTSAIRRVSVVKTEAIDMAAITSDQVVHARLLPPKGGVQMSAKFVDVRFFVSRPPIAPAPPRMPAAQPSSSPLSKPATPGITAH